MSRPAKITFTVTATGKTYDCTLPFKECAYALADGWACPVCGKSGIAGRGRYIESHDTYAAEGGCADCKIVTGEIRVKIYSTLFGLEEDERVLNGRVRVY